MVPNWTPARVKSFIVSGLRACANKWPPKYEAKHAACVGVKTNKKTGRQAKHYVCAHCHQEFPGSEVEVDHIIPVVDPKTGFTTWDEFIVRMFTPRENFQVLCVPCHRVKSKKEKDAAKV